MENIRSPVLDFQMIESNIDLFRSIDRFEEMYYEAKNKPYYGCMACRNGNIKKFVQYVRDKIVENNMSIITSKLNPRTIIRYGSKIYRASEII